MNTSKASGILAAIIAVLIWGSVYLIKEYLLSYLSVTEINFWGAVFTTMIYFILLRFQKKQLSAQKKQILLMMGLGIVGIMLTRVACDISIKYTGGVMASIIVAFVPVMCVIFESIHKKKRPSFIIIGSVFLSIIGVIMTIGAVTGQKISVLGCLAGFISNGCWIVYCYALGYMEEYKIDPMVFLLYQFLGATIVLIPFMFAEGMNIETIVRGDVLAGLLFLGFANGLLAYGLFNYAVRVIGILIPNVINNFIPVVTIGIGVMFFHAEVNLYQYIGVFLILVSILIISLKKE